MCCEGSASFISMASEPEEVGYDDDFEEASDDDGMHKTLNGAKTAAPRRRRGDSDVPAEAPAEVFSSAPLAMSSREGRPSSKEGGARPGRRRAAEEEQAAARQPVAGRTMTEEVFGGKPPPQPDSLGASAGQPQPAVEMNTSTGSGFGASSGAGRRPVRAKVSVGGSSDGGSLGRPGTGDSTAAKSAASRPIWLQSDASVLPRHVSPSQGASQNGLGASSGGQNPPASASGAPPRSADMSRGGRPPRHQDPDVDFDSGGGGRLGTADGDDRKVQRLQQEIKRLTARLKEAELYSSQDEGLPLFTLEEIEVGCLIGQGGFCSVHHTMWRCTPCAVKKIFDPVITDDLRSEFENECRMLRRLRHPNVITILAVCRVPPALSILTEFVGGGSMFELLHSPPKAKKANSISCEPACLLPVMQQASAALAYLHAMLVVHRDVKSHNLLLTPGFHPVAKLCDFGLARTKSELCTGTMQWAGTACYMAPELFAKRKYTEAVDTFACGVMLWEAMTTEIPHCNMEPCDIAVRVTKDGAGLPVTHSWPKSLKALLRTSLAVAIEERPEMTSMAQQIEQIILEFPLDD